ncbi:MAG: D-alanine--D-alanine ligase [Bacteroidota bacterium]
MKKKVAIVHGGYSGENVISAKSATMILNNIDKDKFDPYLILITPDRWVLQSENGNETPVDKNDFSVQINTENVKFDVVFNIIHGTPGENGLLQGYFEMMNIPFTSSGSVVSAVTFHKYFCNCVVMQHGVLCAPSLVVRKNLPFDVAAILKKIQLPCFVKPCEGGSSIGTTKVSDPSEMMSAIQEAFKESDSVLIEQNVDGTELTCGVLRLSGVTTALPVTEIVSRKDFFDYEAKYTAGVTDEITPARISPELTEKCQRLTESIFDILGCKGVARVDYILSGNDFYFLEINTVPGMSEASIIPQQSREYGLPTKDLITLLLSQALEK